MKKLSLIAMVGSLVVLIGCGGDLVQPSGSNNSNVGNKFVDPNRGNLLKMHHFKENPNPSIADQMKDPHPGTVYISETDLGKAKKPTQNSIDVNKLNNPNQSNSNTQSLGVPLSATLQ